MDTVAVSCCQPAVTGCMQNCKPFSLARMENTRLHLHRRIRRSLPYFPGIQTGYNHCKSLNNSMPRCLWLLMAGAQGFAEVDGGGGDGFKSDPVDAIAVGQSEDTILKTDDDAIILHVEGMSCGGCVASVKRILEGLPQVASATVNLDTAGAVVWTIPEARGTKGWQEDLGDIIASHLTNCGFKSSVRGS